jgi:hypothetical protein
LLALDSSVIPNEIIIEIRKNKGVCLLRAMRQPGDVYVIMGSGPVNRVIAPARLHG